MYILYINSLLQHQGRYDETMILIIADFCKVNSNQTASYFFNIFKCVNSLIGCADAAQSDEVTSTQVKRPQVKVFVAISCFAYAPHIKLDRIFVARD